MTYPRPDHSDQPRVSILMGVYEGERYLEDQLDSFAAQHHTNWTLLVSDDSPSTSGDVKNTGGHSASANLIAAWSMRHPERSVSVQPGPRQGFARNFLTLLAQAPDDAPYVALSDQDDVWFPDKLARAVSQLGAIPPTEPALYCAATMITDEGLTPQHPSQPFRRPPTFRNALIQSIGGGNTMVLNQAALRLAQACLPPPQSDPVAHDWWLYQIVSGHGGTILRDDRPVLFYRQHGANQIGANSSLKAKLVRIRALLAGRFRDWTTRSLASLEPAVASLTPDARQTLDDFRQACEGPRLWRLVALWRSGVVRQGRLGTVALYIACLLGRL